MHAYADAYAHFNLFTNFFFFFFLEKTGHFFLGKIRNICLICCLLEHYIFSLKQLTYTNAEVTCSLMVICGASPASDVVTMSSKANCGCGGRLGVDPGVVVVVLVVVVTVGVTADRATGFSGCGVLIAG